MDHDVARASLPFASLHVQLFGRFIGHAKCQPGPHTSNNILTSWASREHSAKRIVAHLRRGKTQPRMTTMSASRVLSATSTSTTGPSQLIQNNPLGPSLRMW